MMEYNQQVWIAQTQSSSARMTMEELLKKHGRTLGNKTGAILMPLSKGQRKAIQKIKQTNTD